MRHSRTFQLNAVMTAAMFLAAVASTPAHAVLLAYDGFNYTVGAQLQGLNGGSGWSGAWQANVAPTNSGSVVSGLSYTDTDGRQLQVSGGAAATDANVFFSQLTRATTESFGAGGTTTWVSFLVRNASFTTGLGYAAATLGQGYTFGSPAMVGGLVTSLSGTVGFVAPFYGSGGPQTLATVAANAVTLVALRFDFAAASGNDALSLWLNPKLTGSAGVPDASASLANYASIISGLTLVHGDNRTFTYDEIRIGQSFADVTPVPEPQTWVLLAGGALALAAVARRRVKA